ncbi:NAD-binding protein [Halovenus marina]|uniref:NAD-binding protein n=1 Tax=Halovenus marina TaxID=3396621 RepID=UPI003F56EE2E
MAPTAETRWQWFGVRAAVISASLVAFLSLGTGIANITVGVHAGPLDMYVPPEVQAAAGFTGTLTGFIMLLSTYALRRGLRVGWYATVILLPVTAIQGLIQVSVYSMPLVVLSILSLPALLVNYRRFDRPISLSTTQIAAILALTGTLTYGSVGAFALREEFTGVTTLTDAFYYTIVTASTVGYGDITPQSQQARLFGISVVVLGTASFAITLGSVLGPAIEARFSRALGTMTDTEYELFEDHVVVLGYGELTEPLLEELADDAEFIVVTPDREQAQLLRDQGINVSVGDPSDEETQHAVAIEHARAVIVATNDDAEDALAILTARELSPDARIVAAATVRDNVNKLKRAGADTVLSPAVIGGRLLVRSALGEEDIESLADRVFNGGEESG